VVRYADLCVDLRWPSPLLTRLFFSRMARCIWVKQPVSGELLFRLPKGMYIVAFCPRV
jgi:hypothetical protein